MFDNICTPGKAVIKLIREMGPVRPCLEAGNQDNGLHAARVDTAGIRDVDKSSLNTPRTQSRIAETLEQPEPRLKVH